MAQSKHQIEALLAEAGSHPRHRFGQNFMIDQNLVRLVAEAGELSPADVAVEVGPGTGTLTEELLARAGRVVAVEIDRDLAGMLRGRLHCRGIPCRRPKTKSSRSSPKPAATRGTGSGRTS